MTHIIGMTSQKGGSEKSTLARLFACELAQDDFTVKIAALDTQRSTCTEWATNRTAAEIKPEIQVQPFETLSVLEIRAAREYLEQTEYCWMGSRRFLPHTVLTMMRERR